MKRFLVILSLILFSVLAVEAKANKNINANFESVIQESGVEKNVIAVSIRDLNSGKVVYQLNEKILMHPASVQKLLTLPAAIDVLGEEYEFETKLFSRTDNEYILELGADPYLSESDLRKLSKNLPNDTKKVYIDDSIIERKSWGEGWQWDDDMNILMPKFNAYNLDKNLLKITVLPTQKDELAMIVNQSKYPLVFFNNIKTGINNDIRMVRDTAISANTLLLEGSVNKPTVKTLPVNNLKRYFEIKFLNILADRNIYMKHNLLDTKVLESDKEVAKISHPVSVAIDAVLKNSNNLVSETLAKLAGAKITDSTGTDVSGIKVFNNYCEKLGIDSSKIRLADASGVSKNNLINADFVSEYLVKNKDNKVLESLPSPGEGTLTHRMLPIKDNLKAKTGSLSDISSIAGYLTTKKGRKYAFCIITNDPTTSSSDKKVLEDFLIREAYFRL